MSDEVLVRAENVSKRFCRSLKRSLWYGLQDLGSELIGGRHRGDTGISETSRDIDLRQDEFWAVQDVKFALKRGECLGLIGSNGAGKSTLLRMLCGLIRPDSGNIQIRGRVGGVIALGAGFNPILTGRENIWVSAAILGLSKKEVCQKTEEIIDFAEIGEFIDSPVQTYSSGMQVRLGFAVATALNPDVLILDEVLAVGDGAFRAKCFTRIGKLVKNAAVIFVSHDLNSVGQMCTVGMVLDKGRMVKSSVSPIGEALNCYSDLLEQRAGNSPTSWDIVQNEPLTEGALRLPLTKISYGGDLRVEFECNLIHEVSNCVLRATIFTLTGDAVFEWNSRAQNVKVDLKSGRNLISLRITPVTLRGGIYDFTFLLADSTGFNMLFLWHRGVRIKVIGPPFGQASCQVEGSFTLRSG
jgi:lipopolysaccharide transport system ATP-binding protein